MARQFKPYQTHGRFSVELIGGRGEGWNLIDNLDGYCLEYDTKAEALVAKQFAVAYVKLHGDIDLGSFPYDLNSPLTYCDDRYSYDGIPAYDPRPDIFKDLVGGKG